MLLHKQTPINTLAKYLAAPLSRLISLKAVTTCSRAFDAYLNFLMGKGSGTGWALSQEISSAVSLIERDNPVVFDVGANTGEWTAQMEKSSPNARIFMFEPSPHCQKLLSDLLLPNATLIPCAIGESNGESFLNFSSGTDGSASLHKREDSYFQGKEYAQEKVSVKTIDSVIQEQEIDFVDFMKMDIEGHELFALKGAEMALKSRKIGALSFEFGSGNINSRTFYRDFWTLLTEAGFEIYRVLPCGKLVRIEAYYEDLEYFRGVSNYFAKLTEA